MSMRKASVMELATAAYDLDAGVARGQLVRRADGSWEVGARSINEWLAKYEGQEIVLIAASLDDTRDVAPRTCPRCGRDYQGAYCSYCHEARVRLRGR